MTTSAFTPTGDYVAQYLGPQHLDETLAFLGRDVVQNIFMLSWADNYGMTASHHPDLFHFAGVRVDRKLVAVALSVSGRLMLLDSTDAVATACLGRWYRQARMRFEHVVSAQHVVTPFWETYSDRGRYLQARLDRAQHLLVLERKDWAALGQTRTHTPSNLRFARRGDLDAVFLASAKMHAEETLEDPLEQDAQQFRRHVLYRIETDRTLVWFDDHQRLIFKADVSAQSRYGAQISGVYTAPTMRGQGLGTRAMIDVCEALFRRGIPRVTLYVNQDNHAAHRVYDKVGFQHHCAYQTVFVQESH